MSDTIRKVKNPLLSAAGQGNPFDNFGENALLMPVTPTTPAVLSDGEIFRFCTFYIFKVYYIYTKKT